MCLHNIPDLTIVEKKQVSLVDVAILGDVSIKEKKTGKKIMVSIKDCKLNASGGLCIFLTITML